MKKSFLLFTAILTVFLLTPAVYAADITLGSSCTLVDAIIAANNDRAEGDCPAGRGADTIILSQDITLRAELPAITSTITIEGNGYTISGDNRWRIFYNDGGALTIKDLTMTKGYVESELIRNEDGTLKASTANSIGGAIYNANGTVSISDSNFSDNSTEHDGGAIYNFHGTLSISDSNFSNNSTEYDGGAIYNANGTVSINDSNFSNNSTNSQPGGQGGAIYNANGTVSISDSNFSNNSANSFGGAIDNKGELSIVSSTFSGNSADAGGGAIDNKGELSISDSSFSNNSAWDGGAIRNVGHRAELSISDSSFSNNSAWDGGAIDNSEELTITNSTFSGNSAESDGGAIQNWYGELSIVSSTFSGNSADKGGAICNEEGTLFIINSTFSGNLAESDGGAIANDGELSIGSSTFSGNSADDGGVIYNGEERELSMVNSIIAGNSDTCYSDGRLRHNISNFIQNGSCSPAFEGDPMLGELVEPEDGSPAYFPLLDGSPAIDAADDGYCPETDQIGTVRPQGGGCDIGAIEYISP